MPAVPPDPAVCASQPVVPPQFIPCGDSAKGKEGREQRQNDWDCPGEAKCCKDPDTGCHNVCVQPPIGQYMFIVPNAHKMLFLLET